MATASPPHSRVPSPPRTPLSAVGTTSSSSPPSDDSSIIDEVSFDFSFDQHGNYVRSSKGSAKSTNSSPPTPQDHPLAPADPPVKPPSPILLNSPVRRSSLSRSESAFPILVGASERANAPRQFTRVASGPINPPATASTALSAVKPRPLPRRVGLDDVRPELQHRSRSTDSHHHDEKENELEETPYLKRGSPPLSARLMTSSRVQLQARSSASMAVRSLADSAARNNPHSRQIMPAPSRAGRIPKTSMNTAAAAASALSTIQSRYALNSASAANGAGFDRISEADCNESDGGENPQPEHERDRGGDTDPEDDPAGVAGLNMRHRSQAIIPSNFNQSTSRPRRSMSLSDALQAPPEEQQYQYISQPAPAHQHQHQQPYQRPGTSQGLVPEERGEGRSEHRRSRIEESERRPHSDHEQANHRQSPTHQVPQNYAHPSLHLPSRLPYGHKRRDSDTLRSASPNVPTLTLPTATGSPTLQDTPFRSLNATQSTLVAGEGSMPSRLSPRSSAVAAASLKQHRRSPTAPETNGMGASMGLPDEYSNMNQAERAAPHPPQSYQQQHAAPNLGPFAPKIMTINKKQYNRLDMIGKGGSSRVFRVLSSQGEMYAVKRVSLDKTDADTMNGYMNEIALLRRLEGNSRIIRLFDSEVKAGPGGSKGYLFLLMECGEIDLARLLSEQMKEPMNMVWVAYYWQQMLQAVQVIHDEKIVHSDLKPANFVLVKGQLKLIDFGIANAIANDTTNIQRDHQIGTVNYMSPEAIELPDGMRRLKVGRPSDVWSLGCILYQMIYGQPPFQQLSVYQKMKAIPDVAHVIEFPEYATPMVPASRNSGSNTPPRKLDHLKRKVRADVIETIKRCLCRPPKERLTIPELLQQEWLSMSEPEAEATKPTLQADETIINPYYMRQLLQYGVKLGRQMAIDQPEPTAEELLRDAERLVAELKALQTQT